MEAQRVGHDLATEQQRFKQKAFFFFLIPGYKHKIFSLFLILYLKLGENFDPNCFVPAAAAKLLQLCLTLCDPMDCSPPQLCNVYNIYHYDFRTFSLPIPQTETS